MELSNTDWAKKLLKRPLVEIRRGLSLGFNPPREDSSVLALTAPSGKYVDIRCRLSSYDQSTSKPFEAEFSGFAAAGLSTAKILPGTNSCPPYECAINVVWAPFLNFDQDLSLGNADMYLLPNGHVMEVGTVERNGKTHMLKEYWIGPKPEAKQLPCIVIETKGCTNDGMRQGDVLIRAMGVIGQDRKWVRDTRSRTSVIEEETLLPCKWAIQEVRTLGNSIKIDGREWEVTSDLVEFNWSEA